MPEQEKAVNVRTGERVVTDVSTAEEAYYDALKRERAGYVQRKLPERVAAVDAELARFDEVSSDDGAASDNRGPFDPSQRSLKDVEEYLAGVDEVEALRVLDAEAAGQNRKGLASQREDILKRARGGR